MHHLAPVAEPILSTSRLGQLALQTLLLRSAIMSAVVHCGEIGFADIVRVG